MKSIKNIGFALLFAALSVVAESCTSPYDDSELRNEIEVLKGDLAALKQSVESELAALKSLIDGKITVTDVTKKSDGSTVITLSDKTTFTIYPESAGVPEHLITVVEEDGVLYWAMYDKTGTAVAIEVDGKRVAVSEVFPEMRVENDVIEVSFDGGKTWKATGYEQSVADTMIEAVEVVYSSWQTDDDGNPVALYCVITLSGGVEVKVGMNSRLILTTDSIYVPAGTEGSLTAKAEGVVDYLTITPDGWSFDVAYEAKSSELTLAFASPSSAAINSGAAVANGIAKLMVVFDNGLSAIASIEVSTAPVNMDVEYSYFMDVITLSAESGVSSLYCGLVAKASFDAAALAELSMKYAADKTTAGVCEVLFDKSRSVELEASTLSAEPLSAATEYLFWYAIPTLKDGKVIVEADSVQSEDYKYCAVSFEVLSTTFSDAEIEFSVAGSNGYIIGWSPAEDFKVSNCLDYYEQNKNLLTLLSDKSYKGSFLKLFAPATASLSHNTTYVAWFLECGGDIEVSKEHLQTWRFTTRDFTTGGELEVVASDENVGYNDIDVKLSTEGHIYMYYKYIPSYEMSAYANDEAIMKMLLKEGDKRSTTEAVIARCADVDEGDTITLVAAAVDTEGKIGKLFKREYTTKVIEYSDATLEVEAVLDPLPTLVDSRVKVSCEGAVAYKYMLLTTDSSLWQNVYKKSVDKVGKSIIINAEGANIKSVAAAELEDGCLKLVGLSPVEHIIVIVAEMESGAVTHPKFATFTPMMDMGDIVYRSDANWSDGKPTITKGEIVDRGDNAYYKFGWYCTPIKGYTAYTMTMTKLQVEELFMESAELNIPKFIAYIVENCDIQYAGTFNNKINGSICEYSENGYLYTVTEFGEHGEETKTIYSDIGVYSLCPQGNKLESMIYTTWVDSDGNFHEPFAVSPVTWNEE